MRGNGKIGKERYISKRREFSFCNKEQEKGNNITASE
jgi:hypothetical protein